MQRYFINKDHVHFPEVIIDGDDARHMQKVMRMTAGDECLCAVSGESVYECIVKRFEGQQAILEIKKTIPENHELPVHITIAQGLPKGDKMELILQKGTECGASEFIPYEADRSVVKWTDSKWDKKAVRFQKIIKEAAEQSHRSTLPTLNTVHSRKQLINLSSQFDYKIVAYEETAKRGEQTELANIFSSMKNGSSLLLVIGPEGGLSGEEIEDFTEKGFKCCGFGQRILRTETAALFALSAASYHFEILNGVN
jgi:16S rRNA (uracil1498-N3)-methyltransferase